MSLQKEGQPQQKQCTEAHRDQSMLGPAASVGSMLDEWEEANWARDGCLSCTWATSVRPQPKRPRWRKYNGALASQKDSGLSLLTNADSSNDWGGNDRQGDAACDSQVSLVLGGLLALIPAVDLREEGVGEDTDLQAASNHRSTRMLLVQIQIRPVASVKLDTISGSSYYKSSCHKSQLGQERRSLHSPGTC